MTPEEFDELEAAGEPVKVAPGPLLIVLQRTTEIVDSNVPGAFSKSSNTAMPPRRPAKIAKTSSEQLLIPSSSTY